MSGWQKGPVTTCPACGHTEETPHGRSRYVHHGCRCDVCRKANTDHQAEASERRAARLNADPTLAKHGTTSTCDNWLCRCEPCRAAKSEYNARQHAKRAGA